MSNEPGPIYVGPAAQPLGELPQPYEVPLAEETPTTIEPYAASASYAVSLSADDAPYIAQSQPYETPISEPMVYPTEPTAFAEPEKGKPGKPKKPKVQFAPGTRRRAALVVAMLYLPILTIGYALYTYSTASCVAGPICSLGSASIWAQIGVSVAAFAALYALSVRPLAAALDPQTPATDFIRTLRQVTRYETVRPLLALFGGAILLLFLYGVAIRAFTWPAAIIGLGGALLLLGIAITGDA